MSRESTMFARTVLYQAQIAQTREEVVLAIKSLCTDDDITAVESLVRAYHESRAAQEKEAKGE